MISTWYRRLATAMSSRCVHCRPLAARRSSIRPQLEQLEARITPDTYTWNRCPLSQFDELLWSYPGNWREGRSPSGDPGAALVFPDNGCDREPSTEDDIPGPVNVASIEFDANYGVVPYPDIGAFLNLPPGGTITVNNGAQVTMVPDVVLTHIGIFIGHTISVGSGGGLELHGQISGDILARLDKTGDGTLVLAPVTGANDWGFTDVDAGELIAIRQSVGEPLPRDGAVSVLSGATLSLESYGHPESHVGSFDGTGHVILGVGATLNTGYDLRDTAFSGVIDGPGSLVKVGTGTFTLAGTTSYTGSTSIQGGTLSFGADYAASSGSDVTVDAGGTLDLSGYREVIGSLSGSGTVVLGNGGDLYTGGNNSSTTFSGTIIGSGFSGLVKFGTGTMTLAGQDTHTGATLVIQGVLRVGAANATSPNSDLQMAGLATFDLNNFNTSIAFLLGNGGVTLGRGTLTVTTFDVGIGFIPFEGIISGTGGLVVTGSHIQTLSGNNTYTGPTTISSGTLFVNGFQPSSNVDIRPAGTLAGRGTVGMISAQGTISPSGGFGSAILSGGATLFNAGSQFRVNLRGRVPGTGYDQLDINGSINLGGFPTLNVALNFPSTVGYQFVIMLATGGTITGTFAGLQDGQVFAVGSARFQINYTPNSVFLTHVADAATQLRISAPPTAVSGTPFDMTLTALDPGGNIDPLYTGTVTFTTSDTDPRVVLPAAYTFTTADVGTHTFTNTGRGETTLITLGDQTITATDQSGITGTATVTVMNGGGAPRSGDPPFAFRFLPPVSAEPGNGNQTGQKSRMKSSLLTPTDRSNEQSLGAMEEERVKQFSSASLPSKHQDSIVGAVDLFFWDDFARFEDGFGLDLLLTKKGALS